MAVSWPNEHDADAFYGHPGNRQNPSIANPDWVAANIFTVKAPFAMTYAGKPIPFVRIHVKCRDSLDDAFHQIWETASHDPGKIHEWGADVFSGSYVYRLKRTSNGLSMHAYGAAIDFDQSRNKQGGAGHFTASSPVVKVFKGLGWEWGGDWVHDKDPMHFQAARTH